MSRFRLRAPSPALVVSIVALIVAMGGTSYAAFKIGTKNIKNGAVTTKKLHNGAVTNKKLANGAVTANDINTTGLTVPNANHANTADTSNGQGTLPSGKSESGVFGAASGYDTYLGIFDYAAAEINFTIPLATSLDSSHTIDNALGKTSTHCSGPGHADPGYLCLYEGENDSASGPIPFDGFAKPGGGATSEGSGADPTGSVAYWETLDDENYVDGQWTVTAP